MRVRWLVWGAALVAGIAVGVGISAARHAPADAPQGIPAAQQLPNPNLDPGTRLNTVAPAFTLTNEFGKKVSLRDYRGKVVVLSFNDPECTTICPLTTTAMLEAKKLLGPAAANVQVLGVGANPEATGVKSVREYSQAHHMLDKWLFLTGSLPRLTRVWNAYGIAAAVVQGAIDHTPATFVIDPQGRETRLFISAMSYSSVPQLAEVMARGIAAALPGHPRVGHSVSLGPIKLRGPRHRVPLNGLSGAGRTTWLGPGSAPHLVLFFDSWDPNIAANLKHLNRYAAVNAVLPLVAIDELNVEPSVKSFWNFIKRFELGYSVVVDTDGRVADGYGVQDSPWLTLVSGKGKILWSYDVAVNGWPSTARLVSRVHAALAHARG
jgi:cytochrome oxidase Cu insertion factor (SCO1/SenC/PrrC family)